MAEQDDLAIIEDAPVEMSPGSTELITEDQDDTNACIALPTYEDTTPEKVFKNMREVFKGFTYDEADDGSEFTTVDSLAEYVQASLDDIREAQTIGETAKMVNTSAALARFWVTGDKVDKALKNAHYGNGACNQLAAKLKKSVPYIYQLRDVAKQLTVQDCFLLGIRGCTTTHLRKLAQIKDPDTCKQIIAAFIADTTDTSDVTRIERATRAFKAAINDACKKVNLLQQSTTNPDEIVEDPSLLVNPSYGAAIKALDEFEKKIRKNITEDLVYSVCDAADDFGISASVPNAQEHLDNLKNRVGEIKKLIESTQDYLQTITDHLTSLEHAKVNK